MKFEYRIAIDAKKVVTLLCIIILLISSWAGFSEGSKFATDDLRRTLNYSLWIFGGVALLLGSKVKKFSVFELTAMLSILIYRGYNIFYAYDYRGLGLTNIFLGIFICLQTDEIRAAVFKYFKYIMVVISIIGIFCYISYTLKLGISYTVVERGGGVSWIDYHICYLMNEYGRMTRLTGFFDEPGYLGTWVAFFLCADGLNLRKKENIILFIAGILTFSLAFVLLLMIYFILMNLSNWKRWIWAVILVLLYIFALPNAKTGNYAVDRILERMMFTEEGLVGNNRYGSAFERVWQQTINNGKIYFGYGAGYAEIFGTGEGQGLSSIKSYLVNFGIVGTVIIFGPILISSVRQSLKKKNRGMFLYIVITFISLYQRPYLFVTPYFIIFICGVSYTFLKDKDEIKEPKVMEIENGTEVLNRYSNL